MTTRETGKCERCEEKIKPVDLAKDWPMRLRGYATTVTRIVTWRHIRFGALGCERPRLTESKIELCDGCWGDLLEWANEPEQERIKIAARHRQNELRVKEVAEARREKAIQNEMKKTTP